MGAPLSTEFYRTTTRSWYQYVAGREGEVHESRLPTKRSLDRLRRVALAIEGGPTICHPQADVREGSPHCGRITEPRRPDGT